MKEYWGKPVSKGYAVGRVYIYISEEIQLTAKKIAEKNAEDEFRKFLNAQDAVMKKTQQQYELLLNEENNKAAIMESHLALISDPAIEDEIADLIKKEHHNVLWAVDEVYGRYAQIMEKSKNEMFRERAADFRDVKQQLLNSLSGKDTVMLSEIKEPCIVVCHELLPSDTVGIKKDMILAIVSETGGDTSHSAILARNYEIPAVLGVSDITTFLTDGQEIIVDAVKGEIIVDAGSNAISDYVCKKEKLEEFAAETRFYLNKEPVTKDGTKIQIMLNVGSPDELDIQKLASVDGAGLFRTEFLFMQNDHIPAEGEQFEAYKKILTAFDGKPVILRTLDIGGDKTLSYYSLPEEENPFLGERALRFCFSHQDIFITQLRAALRASVYGNLWIMFPMVGTMEDIKQAKSVLYSVMAELDRENIAYDNGIKIGIMIEIPSIALIADKAAKEVDFASIGSNDLIQYTMAADRMNQNVSKYYQNINPAVLRLINYTVQCFSKEGKIISVCGEMGGNPMTALLFLGMGMRKLSMNISSVASVKKMILNLDIKKAKTAAESVLSMSTQAEIIEYMEKEIL